MHNYNVTFKDRMRNTQLSKVSKAWRWNGGKEFEEVFLEYYYNCRLKSL